MINYIETYKNGSGIHIKKKNRGKFTDYCGGKVTEECIQRGKHSSNPTTRKRANFAANARKWKHAMGGLTSYSPDSSFYSSTDTRDLEQEENGYLSLDKNLLDRVNAHFASKVERERESEDTGWDDISSQLQAEINAGTAQPEQKLTTEVPKDLKDRLKTAMTYLIRRGFNKEAAAGIVGVLSAESLLIPGKVNEAEDAAYGGNAGKGIAQWSNSGDSKRRDAYDKAMAGKQGLEAELDYFITDLNSRPLVRQALASATSVEDAVKAMHLGYENGSSTAFATPEQLQATYSKAHRKLYNKDYSYADSHGQRLSFANTAYGLV